MNNDEEANDPIMNTIQRLHGIVDYAARTLQSDINTVLPAMAEEPTGYGMRPGDVFKHFDLVHRLKEDADWLLEHWDEVWDQMGEALW